MCEVGAPGVDVSSWNLVPRTSIPGSEAHFDQPRVDSVLPAPCRKHASCVRASSQGRGDDDVWQSVASSEGANAMGQPLGLARVDLDIGAADAPAFDVAWARMAPHV